MGVAQILLSTGLNLNDEVEIKTKDNIIFIRPTTKKTSSGISRAMATSLTDMIGAVQTSQKGASYYEAEGYNSG